MRFRGMMHCALAWLFVASPTRAERLPLTWANIFAKNYGVREAVLSPDGKQAAVVASTPEGNGIFLISTEEAGQQLTSPTVPGRSPAWHPDGRSLVYVESGELWSIAVGGTEPNRIRNSAQARAPTFSPDGATIAFYSTESGYQDIWLVSSDGENLRQLTHQAMSVDDPRFAPGWSPDGRTIAYISNRTDYWSDDLWLADVATGETTQLSRGLMASSTPVFSRDGSQIALLGTAKDEYWYEDLAYIYLVDARTGEETILEMGIHATDWLHNHRLFWSADGKHLYFLYHERGDLNLWSVPSTGGVATRVSSVGGAVRDFEASADGTAFALVRSTPTRGYELDWISVDGGAPRRLTRASTEWEGSQEPIEISFRSFDGLYVQGFLYRPDEFDETRTYPALINVHGGGTNAYLRRDNLVEQALAERGYLVFAINYRGGSGFGRDFQDLSIRDWANGQARDAGAAARFVRTLPYSNGKVGIYGYSYGGILSMAAIARDPDAFDAAVPMAGIYDFADAYENADRLGKIFIKTGHGGSPAEQPDVYAVSNTLARLGNVRTPLLVMHGEADVRAPFRQYQLAVEMLSQLDKDFEHKSYPDEPHGFRDPQNRIDMYGRLETFFAEHLR